MAAVGGHQRGARAAVDSLTTHARSVPGPGTYQWTGRYDKTNLAPTSAQVRTSDGVSVGLCCPSRPLGLVGRRALKQGARDGALEPPQD